MIIIEFWGKQNTLNHLSFNKQAIMSIKCKLLLLLAIFPLFSTCERPKKRKIVERTFTYADGRYYKGGWRDGKPEGFGRMTYPNGNQYAGKFRRGKKEGYGTFDFKDGGKYCGNFKDNKCDGFGVRYYSESQKYVGNWKQDYKSGVGTLFSDSDVIHGKWQKGSLVKSLLHESGKIYGMDISRYQKNLIWKDLHVNLDSLGNYRHSSTAFSSPVYFIFVRATQGMTYVDPYFKRHFENARNVALTCGAYHVFSSLSPPHQQARNFINTVRLKKGDLPPVLDIERNVVEAMHPDTLFKNMKIWLEIVEKHFSCRPIIYVGDHVKAKYFPSKLFEKYHFWIARYSNEEKLQTDKWLFWQFTERGKLGKNKPIDINLYNGSYQELLNLIDEQGFH